MTGKSDKFATGFTIPELLISIVITGILLVAIGVAFDGAIINYQQNKDISQTTNLARQAVVRMTNDIRTGQGFDTTAASSECTFTTAMDENITYEYRSNDEELYLIQNADSSEYLLCENVSSMTFNNTLTDDGLDVRSVQITMTISIDDVERKVSGAAVVRKNLEQ